MNKTQASVFFAIIVIGVITSIFILSKNEPLTPNTTPREPNKIANSADPAPNPAANKKAPAAKPLLEKTLVTPIKPALKVPTPVRPAGGFATEKALMDSLAKAIQDKSPELFFDLTGQTSLTPSARAHLADLLKKGNLKLDPKQSLSAIGRTQNSTRWSIRLLSNSNERIEIITDLGRDPKGAWVVKKMRPLGKMGAPLKTMISSSDPASAVKPKTNGARIDVELPDAMMVAYAFSKAAIARDIKTARALSDPKRLNNEKLAALLIALEEGEFRLKTSKALIITLSRDDLTWAIIRVESAQEKSEFGVEINLAEDGRWLISGLTFSKLISMTAMAAGGGDVAYTPIRKNPKGGDSLVLYFEFDNEQVSTRTRKQLAIVAGILNEDKNRKLHINGHADAKGDDNYNVALSKRRTDAVRSTLIELGVKPDQIATKAFGETMPLKPNFKADGSDNPTGRAQNRRTEIYLDF